MPKPKKTESGPALRSIRQNYMTSSLWPPKRQQDQTQAAPAQALLDPCLPSSFADPGAEADSLPGKGAMLYKVRACGAKNAHTGEDYAAC